MSADDAALLPTIAFDHFAALDIRVGTIVAAEPFPQARKPAFKLTIDFGPPLGTRRSSAQITTHYTPRTLVGRQVLAVVNFAPRQIGPFLSQVLCSACRMPTARWCCSPPSGRCRMAAGCSDELSCARLSDGTRNVVRRSLDAY